MNIKTDLVIENRIYREGIAAYLTQCTGVKVINIFESASLALKKFGQNCSEVVIMDNNIKDMLSLVYALKRKKIAPSVILLMSSYEDLLINECIAAGADGFLCNNDSMKDLEHCITVVNRGHCCYPKEISNYVINKIHNLPKFSVNNDPMGLRLTSRQTRIVQLIECGLSNKEIARKLEIQLPTVKNHVHHILDRLNVKSRCEAAAMYRRGKIETFLSA
jgi:two-component system, NarL family, nitrate/nitrite response regulator NarL